MEDYAIRRFNGHAEDCDQLLTALEEALEGRDIDGGVRLARELQERDDVFRVIVPSIVEALRQ